MLDTNGYKIFLKNNKIVSIPSPYINNAHIYEHYLFASYSYEIPNDYDKLLNTASNLGLKQLVLSPIRFFKLVQKIVQLGFQLKRIDFEPLIDLGDQQEINSIIISLQKNKDIDFTTRQLDRLKQRIKEIDEELNSIPKQVMFTKYGEQFYILNNGVVMVDQKEQLHEIAPLLSSFIYEVKQ